MPDVEKVNPAPDTRVVSVDVLKGLAIMLVIVAHVAEINFVPSQMWLYYNLYTFLDVFGPSMFVFLSSIGVVFSFKKRKSRYDEKKARNAMFQRALIILLMGFIPNIFINSAFGLLSFWLWFVLQFIAFSQIITYYALKIPRMTRGILAFLIIFIITPNLFSYITGVNVTGAAASYTGGGMTAAGIDFRTMTPADLSNPYALAFWLLFFRPYMTPIIPWIAVPLIASFIGEDLVKAQRIGTSEARRSFSKTIVFDGTIFTAIAIAFGSTITSFDYGIGMIDGINNQPYFQISGLPEFLIMHSNINLLYDLGMGMILLGITYYLIDVRGTGAKGRISNFLNFYGRFSLSLFAFHLLVGGWFANLLWLYPPTTGPNTPWFYYVPVLALYVLFVWWFLYFIIKKLVVKYNGIGTLEWIASTAGRGAKGAKAFFDNQIVYWKDRFLTISEKAKALFKKPTDEPPLMNPVEMYMADMLGEPVVEEPPETIKEREKREKQRQKAEAEEADDDTFGVF
ncbi:MAG TPA: heparan-alpha-glucosaminide N-acetyltransferase domain-containing protein [Candidatus Lokiarchaeia archaeon]|nr:heparan-alpha-glucosaminide N-acetyltransferase domain-containing protein [Candidatus Lokiarchaeia archaeon]